MSRAMSMGLRFAAGCWPGWIDGWERGSLRGVLLAWVFSGVLCTAWIGTFWWPALLGTWELRFLWGTILCSALATVSYRAMRSVMAGNAKPRGCPTNEFAQAQIHYLQENYFEAEKILAPFAKHQTLSDEDIDLEAALLLATIYRRTDRYELAIELLDRLLLLERSVKWEAELNQERDLVIERKVRNRSESS